MPRDYKHHARNNHSGKKRKSNKKQPIPGWIWFFAGLLISAAAFSVLWFKDHQTNQIPVKQQIVEPKPSVEKKTKHVSTKPASVKKERKHPQFEFYSVLPEMEVEVPPETLRPSARPSPTQPRVPTSKTGIYQLQVASYRSRSDADRMKASLALKGISANIEKVSINDKTYYRVRSGPYNRDQVYSLHTRLKNNKVDSLIIRIKK
jgi:cell division protein FtsN